MVDIFKCKETMPPKDKSENVVTAMTMAEARENKTPASVHNSSMSVQTVTRPRYGHGY